MLVDAAEKPEWFKCKRPKACVKARGLCGEAVAVNRVHRKAFNKWGKEQEKGHCDKLSPEKIEQDSQLAPSCVDGKCILFSPNFGAKPGQQ